MSKNQKALTFVCYTPPYVRGMSHIFWSFGFALKRLGEQDGRSAIHDGPENGVDDRSTSLAELPRALPRILRGKVRAKREGDCF